MVTPDVHEVAPPNRFIRGSRVRITDVEDIRGTFVRFSSREGYGLGPLAEIDIDNSLTNVLVPVDRLVHEDAA